MSASVLRPIAIAGLAVGLTSAAIAASPASPITISNAWARPVVAAGMTAAGYLTVVNRGPFGDRLVGASSPLAARVSLHQSRMVGAMMTMRAVTAIGIPARGRADLSPGGYHLMLAGVRRPLASGARIPLTLSFARAGTVRTSLTVRAGGPTM
jgi:hypothetical protein